MKQSSILKKKRKKSKKSRENKKLFKQDLESHINNNRCNLCQNKLFNKKNLK